MGVIAFAPAPGMFRTGPEKESSGRWYDANFVRWTNGMLRPIYGWQSQSASAVTGAPRAMLTWKDNAGSSWIGIGTHSHLYVMTQGGTLYDITPVGFTSGRADAVSGAGYGNGNYGQNQYGMGIPSTTQIIDATVWTLDTWGQNLLGVSPDDGKIYQWVAPATATIAAQLSGSPTCSAVVVTPERFVFALGTTDPRTVTWCDQGNNTSWTPAVTNQAGSFPLQTFGRILCGKPLQGGTAIWTDADMWLATYIGGTLVYGFQRLASGCGVVSRQAVAVANSQAVWMGPQGFWLYNGFVQPLVCDVADYVFANINRAQISKVSAVRNTQFNEVWWFYPSGSSTENDTAVVWNYVENWWTIHKLARSAGADTTGAFPSPMMISPANGIVYGHESGFLYDGTLPYAETGPQEFSPITAQYQATFPPIFQAQQFVPDDLILGDVTATFKTKLYPDATETAYGPFTLSAKTDVRFSARQVKMRVQGVNSDDWRFGVGRLLVGGSAQR
jgi:hypothetical protein